MYCNTTLNNLSTKEWKYGFGALFICVSIIGTLENIFLLITIYKEKLYHEISNIILLSLSFSDFLACFILSPIFALQLFHQKLITNCQVDAVRRFLSAVLIAASAFTLGVISYDRYLHLTKLQYYNLTTRKACVLLFCCWFAAVCIPCLRLLDQSEIMYSVSVVFSALVVFLVIIFCYVMILVGLYKRKCDLKNSKELAKNASQASIRAGRTVIILLVCFALMVFPIMIPFVFTLVGKSTSDSAYAISYIIIMALCLLNSNVNPIIYFLRTPKLKNSLKAYIKRRCDKIVPVVK